MLTTRMTERTWRGLVDQLISERFAILHRLDNLAGRPEDQPEHELLVERLIIVAAALVGLGVEPGPMPAFDLAMASSCN